MSNQYTQPPLDDQLYSLTPDAAEFFKSQTGITNDDALKAHILAVQKKAYEIHGYHCICTFGFTKLKISHMPAYQHFLELGRTRRGAVFLDIGCCFGNDARKAVADGWPAQNVIASDLRREFWDFGHELFKSTPESFPAAFLSGDVLDDNFLPPERDHILPGSDGGKIEMWPELDSLTSLAPLKGKVSAIFAGSFFHLFGEEQQLSIALRLGSLLSPLPGSIIFGCHIGSREKRTRFDCGRSTFSHSPESWREVWERDVFEKGEVEVNVEMKLATRQWKLYSEVEFLFWSVIRKGKDTSE